MKLAITFLVFGSVLLSCSSPKNFLHETPKQVADRMAWWEDARFGMFIHWGVYSVPAGIYKGKEIGSVGEWIMDTADIPVEEYEKFVPQFNPTKFDATQWVEIAKNAGMKYIIITSKHHDGFSLWDSKTSTYDIIDATPFGRDILRELSEACKKADIKLGFYHSIMDWHHPDAKGERFATYRDEFLYPQVTELMNDYDPAVLWFDGEWIDEWTEEQGKEMYQYLRSLKPSLIINNRVGKGRNGMQGMNKDKNAVGDFGTPEQEILEDNSARLRWESCMTMNDTWGYKKNDHNWKSANVLIDNLVDIVSKGGNYLLNVGPTAEGLIPAPSVERLAAMGDWISINKEAIYDSGAWVEQQDGAHVRYIHNKKTGALFAAVLEYPQNGKLLLKHVKPTIGSNVELLGYPSPLAWEYVENEGTSISLPAQSSLEAHNLKHAYILKIDGERNQVAMIPQIETQEGIGNESVVFADKITVSLHSETEGASIYYTLDNTIPNATSTLYRKPFDVAQTTNVNAIAYKDGYLSSEIATAYLSKIRFQEVSYLNEPSPTYQASGKLALVDGIIGKANDWSQWQGFHGTDLQITINLGVSLYVSKIRTHFLQNLRSWIFLPTNATIEVSSDGKAFTEMASIAFENIEGENSPTIRNFEAQIEQSIAFVRIIASNEKTCPSWHPGAGEKAWLFIDEVEILS